MPCVKSIYIARHSNQPTYVYSDPKIHNRTAVDAVANGVLIQRNSFSIKRRRTLGD